MIGSTQRTAYPLAKPRPLGGTAPQSGWTTQFIGVYQVCKHCMLTQSTQLGCSCAWVLAATQTHKLVLSMSMQKPCRSHTSTTMRAGAVPLRTLPRARGEHPLVHPPCVRFGTGGAPKSLDFFPKVCSTYLVIFTRLDLFLRELCFQVSRTIYDA